MSNIWNHDISFSCQIREKLLNGLANLPKSSGETMMQILQALVKLTATPEELSNPAMGDGSDILADLAKLYSETTEADEDMSYTAKSVLYIFLC